MQKRLYIHKCLSVCTFIHLFFRPQNPSYSKKSIIPHYHHPDNNVHHHPHNQTSQTAKHQTPLKARNQSFYLTNNVITKLTTIYTTLTFILTTIILQPSFKFPSTILQPFFNYPSTNITIISLSLPHQYIKYQVSKVQCLMLIV